MLYSINRFALVGCASLALLPLLVIPPAAPNASLDAKRHYWSPSMADTSQR